MSGSVRGAMEQSIVPTRQADKAEAVRAAYLEGYEYKELAERFAVPLNTMRTWLRRSLQKLKACLEE